MEDRMPRVSVAGSPRNEGCKLMLEAEEKSGKLNLVASREARGGSLKINRNVSVYNSILREVAELSYDLAEERYAWLQVIKGKLEIGGETLDASDGAAISKKELLKIKALENETEFLLFDLA